MDQHLDQELLDIEPTSYALFRYDVIHQPHVNQWPQEEREALLARARSGDREAQELLILSCLSFVFYRAWRYADQLRHDDPMDLVSIGNLAMVESLEKALSADNPIKFLISQGAYAIQHYVYYQSWLIRRNKLSKALTPIASLDEPLGQSELTRADLISASDMDEQLSAEEQDAWYEPLYQALQFLTARQREVVVRHFGLDGEPESLADIGRSMSINPESAWKHWKAARRQLAKLLNG